MVRTEANAFRSARLPLFAALLRLYRMDAPFRSSTDFAIIGLFVYWFIAPLPLPSFLAAGPAQVAPLASSSTAPALFAPPPDTTNIAQLARAATPAEDVVHREWFKLSAPEIVPA